ncbi:MAG: hypothetical protein KatS3mg077_2492 [Candidatus Binatia bacterium]|nr:MAG: hypothetical protein KatS3mg077_2492 [Candidatus Binatia bacterium]
MPNHVHGILVIAHYVGRGEKFFAPTIPTFAPTIPTFAPTIPIFALYHHRFRPLDPPPPHDHHPRGTSKTIGSVIRGFKIGVTKWFRLNAGIESVLATQLLRTHHP